MTEGHITSHGASAGPLAADIVRAQVDRIAASSVFRDSPKLRDMLVYIANRTLAGEERQLKEYAIAVDAFGRAPDFDPRGNNIVRRQADRLRDKLVVYFASEGAHDTIAIDVPKGHYVLKAAPRSSPAPPGAAPSAPEHNLLAEIGTLIGRDSELDELAALLRDNRLVTILGGGGLGKTRLALALGARMLPQFPGGVWFVALDKLSDSALVDEAVLTTLGLPVEGARPPRDTLLGYLATRRALLILDSAEHVLGSVGFLVPALLRRAPEMRVLLTSREALTLADEQAFRIPPLAVPPETADTAATVGQHAAARLFVQRGRAALGRFELDDDSAVHVAEICRKLDGVPLAIELAAARLPLLTPRQLDAALADRLSVLGRGPASAPPRQRTLQAALDWSYALLSADERRLLQRLSVFAGATSLYAALAVAGDIGETPEERLEMLSSLVGKSLVAVDRIGGETRYRLLETTRSYAAKKRRAAGDRQAEPRLAAYIAATLDRARIEIETTPHEAFIGRYGGEIDNIRTALAWTFGPDGDIPLGLTITALAMQLGVDLGLHNEVSRWLRRAEPHLTPDTPPIVTANILMGLGFRYGTGVASTLALTQRACEAAACCDDAMLQARALLTMVQPLRFFDAAAADRAIEAAFALTSAVAPTKTYALALGARGFSASLRGDLAAADADFAAAHQIASQFDYRFGATWVGILHTEHALLSKRSAAARELADQAWISAERSSTQAFIALTANLRAACALLSEDHVAGRHWLKAGLVIARELGDDLLYVSALENLALAVRGNDAQMARRLAAYCLSERARLMSRRRPSEALVFARVWPGDAAVESIAPLSRAELGTLVDALIGSSSARDNGSPQF